MTIINKQKQESHQNLLWFAVVYDLSESSEITFNLWDLKVYVSSVLFINPTAAVLHRLGMYFTSLMSSYREERENEERDQESLASAELLCACGQCTVK